MPPQRTMSNTKLPFKTISRQPGTFNIAPTMFSNQATVSNSQNITDITENAQYQSQSHAPVDIIPMTHKPSTKTSMIWKHGFESLAKVPGVNPDWNCGICGQKYSTRTTVHAKDHLRETHQIEEDSRVSKLTTLHSFCPVKEDKIGRASCRERV